MRKNNRTVNRAAFNAAMDELLDQWWDQELVTDVAYWVKRLADKKGHDPECACHDYYRERLLAAVKALRAWRNRTRCTEPHLTDEEERELFTFFDENAN